MRTTVGVLAGITLLLMAFINRYDNGYNPAFEGTVMDENNKPVAGAFVVAYWTHYGTNVVGTSTSCARVEIARTNEQGRYRIPHVFVMKFFEVRRNVVAYKAGYQPDFTNETSQNETLKIEPFKGTNDERLQSFRMYGSLRECVAAAQGTKKLGALYRALDEEIQARGINRNMQSPVFGRSIGYVEMLMQEKDIQERSERAKGKAR